MEAASGGYHEVGKVLISRGADVNAAPVPSSKDTALTIAADKGHFKFVDLILRCEAHVDVKNKKGNSPLWLAANGTVFKGSLQGVWLFKVFSPLLGGHLDVVCLLVEYHADVDSQDNRKVSCLMASFRKVCLPPLSSTPPSPSPLSLPSQPYLTDINIIRDTSRWSSIWWIT